MNEAADKKAIVSFRITNNYGVFAIFQKSPQLGVLINMGSNTWCSRSFEVKDGEKLRQITTNSIRALLEGKELFD